MNTDKVDYDLIVIGGGASGMMAAIIASRMDEKVLIIEHNKELGKKLKITGGGRCNILNAEYDSAKLLNNYGKSKKYLHSIFSVFGVRESIDFFKDLGVHIKVEERNRAFPISESALDVYTAMYNELIKNNVEIRLSTKAHALQSIKLPKNKQMITGLSVTDNNGAEHTLTSKRYLLSTGGQSHKETGSTGDGFKMLESLRCKVISPTPGLTPIKVNSTWVHKLTGKTLKDVKATFYVDGAKKKVLNNKNRFNRELDINILCTHFGISGPSIINVSNEVRQWLSEGKVTIHIDLFKDKDDKKLDEYLLEIFDRNKNRKLANILNVIYPQSTLESIFRDSANDLHHIDLNKEVNSITREERKRIVHRFKNLSIEVESLMGYDKSIVVDGGLELDEVNFNNMSLVNIPNLHVTGDILNIARPSGGYSLQLCWTTGYVAGRG